MHYNNLFPQVFQEYNLDYHIEFNCFDPAHTIVTGWPLKFPKIDVWNPNTLVVMHFQDWVTISDDVIVELQKVEEHFNNHLNQVLVTHCIPGLDRVYHGPVILAEYCHFNVDQIQDITDRKESWWDAVRLPKDLNWQCLNGRTCNHRRRVADVLNTWSNGILSYGTEIPLDIWHYGTYRGTENWENFLRLLPVYGRCKVNVVTETIYDVFPGVISEKSCFAFAARQIPLVIGYRGIVQDCRDMGFDMFDDLIDNSFDDLPNDVRLEQALELNRQFICRGEIPIDISHRLDRNQHHVMYGLPKQIEQKFRERIKFLSAGWISNH